MPRKLPAEEARKANKEALKADEQFRKLLARLDSKREVERLAAARELREEWPDALPRLLTSYQAVTSLWGKRRLCCEIGILWMLIGVVLERFCHSKHINITPFMIIITGPFVLSILHEIAAPKVRSSYVRYLLHFENIKIVGPLVDALTFRDEVTQQEARQALVKLLPRLQAGDAHLLNGEQREQLRKVLSAGDRQLIIPVLKVYEHIGDIAELEAVERLLYMQNAILIVEIKDVALNCLPFLQLRAQQMQSSQTLLRAAEHASTPHILLRPAANTQTEEETQLLRMSGK